ncbi:MAG: nucleotidyltransferase family protein [Chloroflexota bacterium]
MATELLPIEAVILAAGQSRRMGRPKLSLPWGDTTVLGHILDTLETAGVSQGLGGIVIVSGGAYAEIQAILQIRQPVIETRLVFNPRFMEDAMLVSLQIGITALSSQCAAALIVLGDQPQMTAETVQMILSAFQTQPQPLIAPSYQMRRGHPWLVSRSLFPQLLELQPPLTLRDFFRHHASQIHYISMDTPTILQDLDTPEDYQRYHPSSQHDTPFGT